MTMVPPPTLVLLPEEIILLVANYLPGREVVRLSHVCQRFFYVLTTDHLWNKIMIREKLFKDPDISYYAKCIGASLRSQIPEYIAREKLTYLWHT